LPVLEKAAEIDGEKPRLHFQLATARQMSGDTDGALTAFESEININDDPLIKVMSHLNRMVIYRDGRKWSNAADEMTAVLELQPTRTDDYGELAMLYLRAGNTGKAAKALDAGAEHGFASAQHHYDVAAKFLESEELDASITQFQKAVTLRPDMARAERELGRALNKAGRLEEALPHLERYLELKPEAGDRSRVEGWIATLRGS
jgi:tetratricopeptide (TPR) repeat protein